MPQSRGAAGVPILTTLLALTLVLLAILVFRDFQRASKLTFDTRYQAVLLTNGQILFGRLENVNSPFPSLTDVYYMQTQMDQETKQVKNLLVKRGKEWHSPDRTFLNVNNILLIEPVKPDSDLAKSIAELRDK